MKPADIALGIDVGGERKGFHVVALDAARKLIGPPRNLHRPTEIRNLIAELRPAVVAIDAPCGWSVDKSREAERALARAGIRSFCTPSRVRAERNPTFYGWMFQGERAFKAATVTHPHYGGGKTVRGHSIEVFPNATTIALTGQPNPAHVSKGQWRRQLLADQGIEQTHLTNIDYVDAALCALTGLWALHRDFVSYGDTAGGFLVAPKSTTPTSAL
jgi:predicted RNase H-like nuclease